MTAKILFVDDDPNLLAGFRRTLKGRFDFDTAVGASEALEMIRSGNRYAVVVADMSMPGMNGIELLEQARVLAPDIVAVMLTGNADQNTAVDSVNRGQVFRFLNKPSPPDVLIPAIDAALQRYELRRTERELLEGTVTGCVKLLTEVLGMVAPDALGRGQRLRLAISRFVQAKNLTPAWECEVAALLSAIGYAAVPPTVLEKLAANTPLSLAEETIVRRVPQIGHDLLRDIPRLNAVADAVLYQRKHFDGTGYPNDDRAGDKIPLAARLLRIFSDRIELEWDGIVKDRAHAALAERTGFYDPHLLSACFEVYPSFLPNALVAGVAVAAIAVRDLEVGQVVVSDICTHNGLVIVTSGHALSQAVIERIKNFADLGEVKEPVLVQEKEIH